MKYLLLVLSLFSTTASAVVILQDTAPPPAGGVPVIESWVANNNGGSSSATITINKPSGVSSGDYLMIIAMDDSPNQDGPVWQALSGWTKQIDESNTAADASVAVWVRVADGTEGANITVTGDNDNNKLGWYLRISGGSAIDVEGTPQFSSGSSQITNSITTLVDNTLAISVQAFDGGDGVPFVETGGNGWAIIDEENSGTTSQFVSGFFATKPMPTAGATGNLSFSPNVSDGTARMQFSIK